MLAPGTRLGPYEIISTAGAGGMGEVYRACDTRLDRTVAVKVLAGNLAARPDVLQRFEREPRAVSTLNHPNICTLHDVGKKFLVSMRQELTTSSPMMVVLNWITTIKR